MTPRLLQQHWALDSDSQQIIRQAATELHLSAQAYDRVLFSGQNSIFRISISLGQVIGVMCIFGVQQNSFLVSVEGLKNCPGHTRVRSVRT
jgi:hypothetical protein